MGKSFVIAAALVLFLPMIAHAQGAATPTSQGADVTVNQTAGSAGVSISGSTGSGGTSGGGTITSGQATVDSGGTQTPPGRQ